MTPGTAPILFGLARLMTTPHNWGRIQFDPAKSAFTKEVPMSDIELFLQLPITAQAAVLCFVACAPGLFVMLLLAPQRNCFFLRWRPETRFLALLASPVLIILWPILLYGWFLKSRGIAPEDLDFGDD